MLVLLLLAALAIPATAQDYIADVTARIEAADPQDQRTLADLHLERGLEYRYERQADHAVQDFERARELYAATTGLQSDEVALTWLEQGRAMLDTGRNEEGKQHFEQARSIYAHNHGKASELYITTSFSVSAADWRIQGPAAALPTLNEAEQLLNEFDAPITLQLSVSHRLAGTHAALGHFTEAEHYFEQGFALTEHGWDPNDPGRAELALAYGLHLLWNGVFSEAPIWLTEALEEFTRIQGPDGIRTQHTLRNLAEAHRLQGDTERARAEYQEAIDHAETDPRAAAHAWNGLGLVALDNGDVAAARAAFEQAERHCREGVGPDSELTAQTLGNLADTAALSGDYDHAIELYNEAMQIYSTALGPDASDVIAAQLAVARLQRESGDPATSDAELQQLIARLESADAPDQAYRAQAWTELARTRAAQQQWRASAEAATQAYELAQKAYGPESPQAGQALSERAWANLHTGNRDQAREDARKTEQIGQSHLGDRIRWLPERTALAWARQRPNGLGVLVDIALETGTEQDAQQVFETILRTRGRVLDELGRRARLAREAEDPDRARLYRDVRVARERLADFALHGPVPKEEVQQAVREKDEAERNLAKAHAPTEQEPTPDAATITSSIPADTALLSFLRTHNENGDPHRYVALLHTKDQATLTDLGDANQIDQATEAFLTDLRNSLTATGPLARGAVEAVRQSGTNLRQRILDPLQNAIAGNDRLLIVPDGTLSAVQWYALPTDNNTWWIEQGPTVHLLTTERDLIQQKNQPNGEGLLCFGDPNLDQPTEALVVATRGRLTECRDPQKIRFSSLKEAQEEINFVATTWIETRPSTTTTVRGPEATKQAFAQQAHGPELLHLATHGYYLGADCPDAPQTPERQARLENPLLLSGLVLSGPNGMLSSEEIAALDLSPARLAVLSACETGSGAVTPGEGVLGLRWAFRLAGVDALVSSLWPVDDEETAAWMQQFYTQLLREEQPIDSAVKRASLERLHQRRANNLSESPAFWAAFTGSGDWR